ncbi:hypothetical protein LVD13_08180 [Flavobacteriaceae bacterium D16]|nr:hypothetical protein [Flavobacteriaceae bacterium D16]
MRTIFLVLGMVIGGLLLGNAQEDLSSYKYIIVPTKFDTFKKENQYQTSTLIKYLLAEKGFNAVYENAFPAELFANRCLGLTSVLMDESNMFTTKAYISFQDCNEMEVYRTETASSKLKNFKESYREAITKSFQSLRSYTYKPTGEETSITVNFDDDVKTLEPVPAIIEMREEKAPEVSENRQTQRVQEKKQDADETAASVVQEKNTVIQEVTPKTSNTNDSWLWYAQEIPNGFQLVDSSPKVVLRIYQTQKRGVYLAKSEERDGIVYEELGSWYFDYYQDGQLMHQTLNIKF